MDYWRAKYCFNLYILSGEGKTGLILYTETVTWSVCPIVKKGVKLVLVVKEYQRELPKSELLLKPHPYLIDWSTTR